MSTSLLATDLFPQIAKRPLPRGAFQVTVPINLESLAIADFQSYGIELPFGLQSAVKKRQIEYLAGRFCARIAMEELGIESPPLVGLAEDRSPVWDSGLTGSITHTQGWASAVVGRKDLVMGLGLDLEHEMTAASPQMIKHICLDAAELDELSTELSCPAGLGLTLIFSAKESFFKATYGRVLRFYGFHAARVIAREGAPAGILEIELVADLNDSLRAGMMWPISYRLLEGGIVETLIIEPCAD